MKAASLILSCLLFLTAPYAYSHGGGLNSDGCHNTSSGGYHCHGVGSSSGGGSSGGSISSGEESSEELSTSQLALAIVAGIICVGLIIVAPQLLPKTKKYSLNDEANEDSHDKEEADKQDSFSVSTTPLLIPQGGGLSLELSF